MRNLISFFKHYKQVPVIGFAYFFFLYQLAWPSKFAESLLYNPKGLTWFVVSFWAIVIGLFYAIYIWQQWGKFKRSEWYIKA